MGSSPILLKIQDFSGPKVPVLSREFYLSFTLDRRVPALSLGTHFGLSANVRTSSSWLPYELKFHRQSLPSMWALLCGFPLPILWVFILKEVATSKSQGAVQLHCSFEDLSAIG